MDPGHQPDPIDPGTYRVAISYETSDIAHARAFASFLLDRGIRVFFDRYETDDLWGRDLKARLPEVFATDGLLVLALLSQATRGSEWVKIELEAAMSNNSVAVLPVRIERAWHPTLPQSLAYREIGEGIERIGRSLLAKLGIRDQRPKADRAAALSRQRMRAKSDRYGGHRPWILPRALAEDLGECAHRLIDDRMQDGHVVYLPPIATNGLSVRPKLNRWPNTGDRAEMVRILVQPDTLERTSDGYEAIVEDTARRVVRMQDSGLIVDHWSVYLGA